ncbi:Protein N-acetyltransferase, RimJ/RimL family [Daejeonella rubra]|uniref:Protein N-acetyltransferase, RimJ/RimL family n=1 Tax=Daejeonella rubra TaxID=990371 RepID=A0A1G9R7T9_9SPHI|nr:GNAT family protein [Daejeonella rubra]SDM19308.1 Protein N-acetyltransferase, RimJ/RimL family [Daejeonella rubra]
MAKDLNVSLESERALLRPLTLEDEHALQQVAADDSLWIFGLQDLSQPGELNKYIHEAIADRENGTSAVWVIIDKKTNKVAGCTRLAEISWKDERGQIGWTWIGRDFQGSGLNKEMKFLILTYGFEVLGLNRIEFKADERNHQSRQALLGIGATREGVLRQHMKIHNGYIRNTVFYSILKPEWDTIKEQYFTNFKAIL